MKSALILLFCALALPAPAQSYPNKPVRMIVPYPPGGGNDTLARIFGQKLTEAWGHQVVVDNRAGAGTIIGSQLAARAAPDGYTLLLSSIASHAVAPNLYSKPGYDPIRDFAYIMNFAKVPGILVVHPSVPAKNAKELVALAKARPNELRHGSTGIGSPHHLAGEIFKTMSGVKMIHVPYKGATPAIADVVGGHIEV